MQIKIALDGKCEWVGCYVANVAYCMIWKDADLLFCCEFIKSNENREQSNHSFVYKLFLSLAIEPVSHFDFVEQTFILCILGPAKLLRSHHLNVLDLRAGFKCKRCVARIGRWFICYGKVKLFFFLLLFTVLLQKLCKRVKIVRARERELSYRFMNSACIKMEI